MKISAQDAWWQVILENDKVVLGKKKFTMPSIQFVKTTQPTDSQDQQNLYIRNQYLYNFNNKEIHTRVP